MSVCKTCGIQFHACSNCGLNNMWEYDYHSYDCWMKSTEYYNAKVKYISFMKTLNEAQRTLFKHILDLGGDFALEYEKWELELRT